MQRVLKTDPQAWEHARRNQRAIDTELQKMSLVKTMKKNLSSIKLKKMQQMAMDAARTTNTKSTSNGTFLPRGPFLQVWSLLLTVCLLLETVTLTSRLAFPDTWSTTSYWIGYGCVVDTVLLVHLGLSLSGRFVRIDPDTGAVPDDVGRLDRKQIARDYWHTSAAKIDLLAALPLQLVAFVVTLQLRRATAADQVDGKDNDRSENWTVMLLALLPLTRVPKLLLLAGGTAGLAQWDEVEHSLERRCNVDLASGLFRILKMVALVLVATHIVACLFLMCAGGNGVIGILGGGSNAGGAGGGGVTAAVTSRSGTDAGASGRNNNTGVALTAPVLSWADVHTVGRTSVSNATRSEQYLVSFYWAAYTISTVGFGDINLLGRPFLLVFAMVVSLLGAVLCGAGITAILTFHLDGLDQASGHQRLKQKCAETFMLQETYPPQRSPQVLAGEKMVGSRVHDGVGRDPPPARGSDRRKASAAPVPAAASAAAGRGQVFSAGHRAEAVLHLRHVARDQRGVDEQTALALLSPALRTDILCHFTLGPVRALLGARAWKSAGLLRSLCKAMCPYAAGPGEELVQRGACAGRMFVLIEGRVVKRYIGGSLLGHQAGAYGEGGEEEEEDVPVGSAFGGECFENAAGYSAVSVRVSHLFCLQKTRYDEVLEFVTRSRRSTARMRAASRPNFMRSTRRGSFSGMRQLELMSSVRGVVSAGPPTRVAAAAPDGASARWTSAAAGAHVGGRGG